MIDSVDSHVLLASHSSAERTIKAMNIYTRGKNRVMLPLEPITVKSNKFVNKSLNNHMKFSNTQKPNEDIGFLKSPKIEGNNKIF